MEKFISIITPCYNGEAYIETAIRSVLAQKNCDMIEHIIVDDGSKDKSGEIIKRFEGNVVKYVRIENNGAAHARNLALSMASGKFVCFLDADDVLTPNAFGDANIEKLKNYLAQNVDIIFTKKHKFDINMTELLEEADPIPIENVYHHLPNMEFAYYIYRREFLDCNCIRFYENYPQDIETSFRYITCVRAKKSVCDPNISFYIQRENTYSNTHVLSHFNLLLTKSKIFYHIYSLHYDRNDDYFLISVVVKALARYYFYHITRGGWKDEEYKTVNDLYDSIIETIKKDKLNTKKIQHFSVFKFTHFISKYYHRKKGRKNYENPGRARVIKMTFDPVDVVLDRISKLDF